jgi:hypothetical protein
MLKFTIKDQGITFDFTDEPAELSHLERATAGMILARLVLMFCEGDRKNDYVLRGMAERILYRDPPAQRRTCAIEQLRNELTSVGQQLHCAQKILTSVETACNKLAESSGGQTDANAVPRT